MYNEHVEFLLGGIVHSAVQNDHEERAHCGFVSDGEGALLLQGLDEGEQDLLVVEKVIELTQCPLHGWLSVRRQLQVGTNR